MDIRMPVRRKIVLGDGNLYLRDKIEKTVLEIPIHPAWRTKPITQLLLAWTGLKFSTEEVRNIFQAAK